MTTPLALPALRRYLRHGTLPQLAAFEAVVRLGSATRAAQALCVAQPTISGHLKKLGDSLGVRLFDLPRQAPRADGRGARPARGHPRGLRRARSLRTDPRHLPRRRLRAARAAAARHQRAPLRAQRRPSLNAIIARSLFGSTGLISRWKSCVERLLVVAGHAAAGDDDGRHAAAEALAQRTSMASTPVSPSVEPVVDDDERRRRCAVGAPAPRRAPRRRCRTRRSVAPQPVQQHLEALAHRRLVLDDDDQRPSSVRPSGPLPGIERDVARRRPCRAAARA